ncbi:G patch domain-containing protein 4 isoform X2 [Drosophila willistoni]|uniref:G patch domain-containing protein 4 isoform X2 n=1 Tax=Drosophila willistoni TaxID=7260 RepID=UPI000C26CFB2|nr:G patch domain-containing protein 4 isoform X2 [Drosophila willistoni]
MDFAKKILSKYGWKEGDGLGKNNTGIAAPLKASLKFDNAGLGVDRAKEFNDHWWERCFNEAANNVEVQVQTDGHVKTGRKEGEDAVEISTKGYSARKLNKANKEVGGTVYENFMQTTLLTQNGGEVETVQAIKVEDIAVSKVNVLTDEELFKACGGRTAHKGARHGLKLSGKLARLEQQEQEMLEKLQGKQTPAVEAKLKETPKKKKKQKKEKNEDLQEEQEEETPAADHVKSKKKKRKHISELPEDSEVPNKKKKSKRISND